MNIKKITFLTIFCLFLASCGDGSSSADVPNQEEAPAPVNLEFIPELDQSESLLGTDLDSNGIRDDIDAYISQLSVTSTQRASLQLTAKTYTQILDSDFSDPAIMESATDAIGKSVDCFFKAFEDSDEGNEIENNIRAYTFNTPVRSQKYIDFNVAASGGVYKLKDYDCPTGQ